MEEKKTQEQSQREIIARNIVNVLDVKEQSFYQNFLSDDFAKEFQNYITLKINDNDASQDISIYLKNNKTIIDKIVQHEIITIDEKNQLFEGLKLLKRKYILHK